MPKTDPRVDAYIAKAQPFAKEILTHIRAMVHKAVPDVEETMKWSFPHFDHRGGMMMSMAGFKGHCSVNFWKAKLIKDPHGVLLKDEREGMGHLGRIESMKDLPAGKIFIGLIKEAARLNDEGVKLPPKKKGAPKPEAVVPDYFAALLKKNKKALSTFNGFPPSHRREYVEWITEAKTEETRDRRVATALEWLAEGKSRNWKYAKK